MAVLVTAETLVLALLALLVAGLLRSHAEILRRLAELQGSGGERRTPTVELPPARDGATRAFDVAGTTLAGDALKLAIGGAARNTLLAFLSSGCLPCRQLWQGVGEAQQRLGPGTRLLIVTKDRTRESPNKLRGLAPANATVVMSSAAWDDYGVKGSPYFIYVEAPSDRVYSEGSATNWDQVLSLLGDALAEEEQAVPRSILPRTIAVGRTADGSARRIRRADAELAAAGIHPGHPSLWQAPGSPGGRPKEDGDGHR